MKLVLILSFVILPVIILSLIWLTGGTWLPITKITMLIGILIYGTIAWLKL